MLDELLLVAKFDLISDRLKGLKNELQNLEFTTPTFLRAVTYPVCSLFQMIIDLMHIFYSRLLTTRY